MAVIPLQLEVDSEVHPELHDMLASIGSSPSRAERFRQLAATGLVWERMRLQSHAADALASHDGNGLDRGSPAAPMSLEAPALSDEKRKGLQPAHESDERTGVAHHSRPAAPAALATPSLPVTEPLVDHGPGGGDKQPGGPDIDAHEMFMREMRSAVRRLPVLTDSIDPAELSILPPGIRAPSTEPLDAVREAQTPTRKAPRSRLVRMKEKGLFKNE